MPRKPAPAEESNDWFDEDFVDLRKGDALHLPLADGTVDVAAQNCLFNIFKAGDLRQAIAEMYRVLRPHGRLVLSDPVCDQSIPAHLRDDEVLRAQCLTGVIPLAEYVQLLTDAGFGTVEIRARRPYRLLTPNHYDVDHTIFIESVEVCAIKDPMPDDGPCVFTGCTAIYHGNEAYFDDGKGHVLQVNQPMSVCDKTAAALAALGREDIFVTGSTWFYDGGGCC
ncbi:MAG: methyltransferase domain-containing protein [Saprospiraceae bacterium]|nr:methyltransferase domain-containing protein [Saprospiraceae bacterium]